MPIPIVIFAQTPPPEHGQSRMVQMALEALREKPELFEVHHVNARFSYSLEDIGESSIGKILLTSKYLYQAIRIRGRVENPILYYVPGPVKWSSVLRDWIVLSILRIFYSRVVFHWHAIGHGEWAHGSDRLKLNGPCCSDRIARKISAWILEEPFASIAVGATSQKDSFAVASRSNLIVHNGIEDPCPTFEEDVLPRRSERLQKLAADSHPCFKVLFLSHGTLEKGTIDALNCMEQLMERCDPAWRFQITFAGGISGSIVARFDAMVDNLDARWPERIQIIKRDYLTGEDKHRCFLDHDIFLAPSRWESFGLTVVEAMAHGMQVVAAASDGVKGVLPDGYPYLAPPADPATLADRLLQCCSDLLAAPNIDAGRALRQRFLEFYQIKKFSENLSNVLLDLVDNDAPSKGSALSTRAHADEEPEESVFPSPSAQNAEPACSGLEKTCEARLARPERNEGNFGKTVNEERKSQSEASDPFALTETPKHRPRSGTETPSSSDFRPSTLRPSDSDSSSSTHAVGDKSAAHGGARPTVLQSSSSSDLRPSTLRPSDSDSSSSTHADGDKSAAHGGARPTVSSSQHFSVSASQHLHLTVYLADQNPGYDRSYGISRMTQIILNTLHSGGRVDIETIASKTSQQGSERMASTRVLPWGTRRKWVRLLTDHLHPLFNRSDRNPDIYYFPKGYLPWLSGHCRPSVVTIHDTIIQYDEDHYPKWRKRWEYSYWAMILKHTLRNADRILTVSESSKAQIQAFMDRHQIPRKEITVTYEPCLYEKIPQPVEPVKENYVIHLASCEPHKRTAHLIRWWHEAEKSGRTMPMLHLIGNVPEEVIPLLAGSRSLVKRPFLDDDALMAAYLQAKALILPSEIEGFGLPALEAYYLGTPVCFVEGTSVEEVLAVATTHGKFSLEDARSLFTALDDVMSMSAEEVRECGLKLRETYTAKKVVERMVSVFHELKNSNFEC